MSSPEKPPSPCVMTMPDIEVGISRMTTDRYELTVVELFVGDSYFEQQLANSGDNDNLLEIHS